MNEEQDNSEEIVHTIDALGRESSGNSESSNATAAEPILTDVQKALAAKTEEANALNDKYLRLAAEFENYKRMAQRDQRDQIKFGNEQLLKELLPVVDNMERAIKAARDDNGGSSAVVQGVDLTLKQLSSTLAKFGVQAVDTVGQVFDPATHQAVSHVPSDSVPRDHVIDEFQKGYRLHDRILRAAMVSVSAGPAQTDGHDSVSN
jgi:molecular chaperone GrpE